MFWLLRFYLAKHKSLFGDNNIEHQPWAQSHIHWNQWELLSLVLLTRIKNTVYFKGNVKALYKFNLQHASRIISLSHRDYKAKWPIPPSTAVPWATPQPALLACPVQPSPKSRQPKLCSSIYQVHLRPLKLFLGSVLAIRLL